MNYVYILRCADGTLYTGWTNDLDRRLAAHSAGRGAKYTRARLPVELVYSETLPTREEAMSREWHIKHLPREEKLALIKRKENHMNITVYLGASEGNDPRLKTAVMELGAWIGASGNALVYGGSKSGLMGVIADSVLASGGEVTGVEPQFFIQDEFQHNGLTRLIVTKDMPERKSKMIELGDAFIAFPGGTGTLEEITEVMSMVSLKHLNAPCIFYNLNGYYNDMKALLARMIEKGLSSKERQEGIYFADDLEEIKRILSSI